jgi:hypothetical protein
MDPELASNGFEARNGDFGALLAGGSTIFQSKLGDPLPHVFNIVTDDGNLRTVEANPATSLTAVIEGPISPLAMATLACSSRTGVLSVNEPARK